MASFAYVRDGIVKYVQAIAGLSQAEEKWIALNRSDVLLKNTMGYNVMPGDLFIDGKFYKKDIETGETALLQEGVWTHPKAVRFAGIMDGEIVGQWGLGKENFQDESEINQFCDDILNSQIIEISDEQLFLVEKGWLYDGNKFTNPSDS